MNNIGCAICAFPITHVHHILPRAYGGSDEATNLITLCPNHHAAMHILISEWVWEVRTTGNQQAFGKRVRRKSARHRALYAAMASDTELLAAFWDIFVPRWQAAGNPFHLPTWARSQRLLAQIAAA